MKRREFVKIACAVTLSATVSQAYDKKLILNKSETKIKDPNNLSKAELKHLPEITIKDKDSNGFSLVEVNVGQQGIIHPSTDQHWIYKVELYANGKKISEVNLEPIISRGFLSSRVNLKDVKKLSAIAKCNLHGIYTSTIDI